MVEDAAHNLPRTKRTRTEDQEGEAEQQSQ